MTDQTTNTLRQSMRTLAEMAPDAPELPRVRARQPIRFRRSPIAMVVAFAAVLLVGAAAVLLINGSDETLDAGAGSTAEVASARVERALDVASEGAQRLNGRLLAAAPSGPLPRFDTTAFGQEMVLRPADEGSVAVLALPVVFGPSELIGIPVYLGNIGGVHGFVVGVTAFDNTPEIAVVYTMSTGESAVGYHTLAEPQLAIGYGYSDDPRDGLVIALTALGEDTSVVVVELLGGERYWQRPVGGSALFSIPGTAESAFTVSTLDAEGEVLETEGYLVP